MQAYTGNTDLQSIVPCQCVQFKTFSCLLQMSQDYDHLTLMQKVEVFEHALENTNGDDLAKILWIKSPSSEVRERSSESPYEIFTKSTNIACDVDIERPEIDSLLIIGWYVSLGK